MKSASTVPRGTSPPRPRLCLILLLPLLLLMPARAITEDNFLEEQAQLLGTDELLSAGELYAPDLSLGELDFASLFQTAKDSLDSVLRAALHSSVLLLAIVLLFSLADGLQQASEKRGSLILIAAILSVTTVAIGDVSSLVGLGQKSMDDLQTFSKVLLPTVATATAAAGSPGAAVAKQLATVLFSDALITLINRFLLPMSAAFLSCGIGYAVTGNEGLKRLSGFFKWLVQTVLGAFLLSFLFYLNLSGAISGSADAVTLKATKFTVSNVVPVVGSILADAAESVLVGASMLRGAIGAFGMIVVLSICIVPFLQLGAHYLAYKGTAALVSTVVEGPLSAVIDTIGTAFGLILAMTASCAILLLISLMSAVSMVAI